MLDLPQATLPSQSRRPLVPLRPATAEPSNTWAPNCGVKPPGKILRKVKQLGLAMTWLNASRSLMVPLAGSTSTLGQPAAPIMPPWASSRSPTRRMDRSHSGSHGWSPK